MTIGIGIGLSPSITSSKGANIVTATIMRDARVMRDNLRMTDYG